MKIEQIKNEIKIARKTGQSVVLIGKSGIGKTAICREIAKELEIECRIINLTTCESVDLRGIPVILENQTVWRSPLPQTGAGILVLDEITSAQSDVQVAAHHILQRERGSDTTLGDGWTVVATGNTRDDRTLVTALSGPLRNRVQVIDFDNDFKTWQSWAENDEKNHIVIDFLKQYPDLFCQNAPISGQFFTPRSWCALAARVDANPSIAAEVCTNFVGEGAGSQFFHFYNKLRKLPKIDEIYSDPDGVAVPSDPSLLFALVRLCLAETRTSEKSLMFFVKRFPPEFATLYFLEARKYFDIRNCSDSLFFIEKNKEIFA